MAGKRFLTHCIQLVAFVCCLLTVLLLQGSGLSMTSNDSELDSETEVARSRLAMGILVDSSTYEACKLQILTYKLHLEQNANLRVSVIAGQSDRPSYWKQRIKELYEQDLPLDGVLLIGEIPIPIVELNGRQFQSDRYYEEINASYGAEVEMASSDIPRPSDNGFGSSYFVYRRAHPPVSNQERAVGAYMYPIRPNPAFYSARVPLPTGGTLAQGHQWIRETLERYVERENVPLHQILSYTGVDLGATSPQQNSAKSSSSNISSRDCLVGWRQMTQEYKDCFPLVARNGGKLSMLHHRMGIDHTANRLRAFSEMTGSEGVLVFNRQLPKSPLSKRLVNARMIYQEMLNPFLDLPDLSTGHAIQFHTLIRFKFPELAGQVGSIAAPWYEGKKLSFLSGLNLGLTVGQLFKVYADWEDLLIGDPTLFFHFVHPQKEQNRSKVYAYANLPLDLVQAYNSAEVWKSWMERGLREENHFLANLALQMFSKQADKYLDDVNVDHAETQGFVLNLASQSTFSPLRIAAINLLQRWEVPLANNLIASTLNGESELLAWFVATGMDEAPDSTRLKISLKSYFDQPGRNRVNFALESLFRTVDSEVLRATLREMLDKSMTDSEVVQATIATMNQTLAARHAPDQD